MQLQSSKKRCLCITIQIPLTKIIQSVVALKKKVAAQLESENAAKREAAAAKSKEEIEARAAAQKERSAKKEADLSRQAVQLRQRINTWIQNNSKAYRAVKK